MARLRRTTRPRGIALPDAPILAIASHCNEYWADPAQNRLVIGDSTLNMLTDVGRLWFGVCGSVLWE